MKPTRYKTFRLVTACSLLLASLALTACGDDTVVDERGSIACGRMGSEGCMAHPPGGGGDPLDALTTWERQDMGVTAPRGLHDGAFHGPTPNQIPGGQVITTKGLVPLLQQGMAVYVFDVLGGQTTLPDAIPAAWAAQPGSFDDQVQQQLAQFLQQVTRGSREAPLVFYCQGPQCWMSFNAARRAIQLGYTNVLWYRGGIEAWQRSGQPLSNGMRGAEMQSRANAGTVPVDRNDGSPIYPDAGRPMSDAERAQYYERYTPEYQGPEGGTWQ